ncbi:hypothetical protein D3C77_623350 [compost metagenome]
MQAEQAAQRPEHIDRALAVAQGGKRQGGAAEQREQHQGEQRQARTLVPVAQRGALAVALGEQQGAGFEALFQRRAGQSGAAVGFAVFQGAGLFLAQAEGFAQPQAVEAGEVGGGRARGHGNTHGQGAWRG